MKKRIMSILTMLSMLISVSPIAMAEGETPDIVDLIHASDGSLRMGVSANYGGENLGSLTGGTIDTAIDGSTSTYSYVHGNYPYYQVDLGTVRAITNIKYTLLGTAGIYMKRQFDIKLSNDPTFTDDPQDDTDIVTVYGVGNLSDSSTEYKNEHTVDLSAEPMQYRYIRIVKTNESTGISCAEIEVQGYDEYYKQNLTAMAGVTATTPNGGYSSGDEGTVYENPSNTIDGKYEVSLNESGALDKDYPGYSAWISRFGEANPYIQIDLTATRELSQIRVLPFRGSEVEANQNEYFRKNLSIIVSNDADFTDGGKTLYTLSGTADRDAWIEVDLSSSNTDFYRYVRVQSSIDVIGLAEVEVWGFDVFDVEAAASTITDGATGVTNTETTEILSVKYPVALDWETVNSSNVYAVKNGTETKTAVNPVQIDDSTIGIDLGTLKSFTSYNIIVTGGVKTADGISVVPYTSGTFKTGIIARVPYEAEGILTNVALGKAAYTSENEDRSILTDGNLNAQGVADKDGVYYNSINASNYAIVDLGKSTTIVAVGADIGTSNWWYHLASDKGPARIYGTNEDPTDISKATLIGQITKADIDGYTNTVEAVESGKYRYILLDSDGTMHLDEILVYAEPTDSFGEWSVSDNANGTRTFEIPVNYVNPENTREFVMNVTNYNTNGDMTAHYSENVIGDTLTVTIPVTEEDVKSSAVLIPTDDDYSVVPEAVYYGFDGFNVNNGYAESFDDSVSVHFGEADVRIDGQSVSYDDTVVVSVVKSDEENPENAFSYSNDIYWYGAVTAKKGYSMTIPFDEEGMYHIRVSRCSAAEGTEYKYYTYKMIDPQTRLDTIKRIVESTDDTDLKAAVDSAVDEVGLIALESLADRQVFAQTGIYDIFADLLDIMTDTEITIDDIVDILNTATIVFYLKNNDDSLLDKYPGLVEENEAVKEYIHKELKLSFTADINSEIGNETAGVTNIESEGIITFTFTEDMNVESLTSENIVIKSNGTVVQYEPYKADMRTFVIDKASLESDSKYEITFTEGCLTAENCKLWKPKTFTISTGTIIPAKYREGYIIKLVSRNKPVRGTINTSFYPNAKLSMVVDGYKDSYVHMTEGVVIDLQDYYEVCAFALAGPGSSGWYHLDSAVLSGSDYDEDFSAEDKTMYTFPSSQTGVTPLCNTMMSAVQNVGKIRYLKLQKKGLLIRELEAYAYVSTEFGTWETQEFRGVGSYTFKKDIIENEKNGTYYMIINAYDEKGLSTSCKVLEVTALDGKLSGQIEADTNTVGITASIVADLASMEQVTDGVTIGKSLSKASEAEQGLSISNDDESIYIDAVNSEEIKKSSRILTLIVSEDGTGKTAQDVFAEMTMQKLQDSLVFASSDKCSDGVNYTVTDLKSGKYYIRMTATDVHGGTVDSYYKCVLADAVKKQSFIDSFMAADSTELKSILDSAINTDEIIAGDTLADESALSDDEFYLVLQYTRDMLCPKDEEITKLSRIKDIIDAAALVKSFYDNDADKSMELIKSCGAFLGDNFDIDADAKKFNTIFAKVKSDITGSDSLAYALRRVGMLSYLQEATNAVKVRTLEKYAAEFDVDLRYAEQKGVSVERAAEYLNCSDSSIYFSEGALKNAFVSAVNEAAKDKPSTSKPVSSGGGSGSGITYSASQNQTLQNTENNADKKETYSFSDMGEYAWANDAVNMLCEKKILNGYDDGTFRPGNYVTRAEFVKMLVMATNVKVDESIYMSFIDVSDESWYFPYIRIAFTNGLCKGKSDFYFDPEGLITREDMAMLVYNYMTFASKTVSGEKKNFTDANMMSEYAVSAVENASAAGVINGFEDGSFRPQENAKRAEAAMIISKIIE
ncbi:MAG: S-layer homology domain-containing protein [Clostridia bacterium]|nr:S-layer homology domain-containing protein [Clostridia bacterium]